MKVSPIMKKPKKMKNPKMKNSGSSLRNSMKSVRILTSSASGTKTNVMSSVGLKRTGRTILINLCGGSSVRLFHSL